MNDYNYYNKKYGRYQIDEDAYHKRAQTGPCFICEIVAKNPNYITHIVYENDKFKAWFELNGVEVITRLNEEILRNISEATGGKYFRITSENEVRSIFKDPGVMGERILLGKREIFQVPLALSILLLCLGMCWERWLT